MIELSATVLVMRTTEHSVSVPRATGAFSAMTVTADHVGEGASPLHPFGEPLGRDSAAMMGRDCFGSRAILRDRASLPNTESNIG